MIASNHALTGALIGLVVQKPLLAIPFALVSHFICDALPHYGNSSENDKLLASKQFSIQLVIDATACVMIVAMLALFMPAGWLVAAVCAFVATAPDFAWLPGYIRVRRGQAFADATRNKFMLWTARIQWFERPIGAVVEMAWAIGAITLLVAYGSAI